MKDNSEKSKMISKEALQYIITSWLRPKIDKYEPSGEIWCFGWDACSFGWDLYSGADRWISTIGVRVCYDDKNDCVGYDIWSYDRGNTNIKIRKDSIEFIEDSEFKDFSKEEIRDLYDKIKNTRIIKCVLNEGI